MYIKSCCEIANFFRHFFNKYYIKFIGGSLQHHKGNFIFYNFSLYLFVITCMVTEVAILWWLHQGLKQKNVFVYRFGGQSYRKMLLIIACLVYHASSAGVK